MFVSKFNSWNMYYTNWQRCCTNRQVLCELCKYENIKLLRMTKKLFLMVSHGKVHLRWYLNNLFKQVTFKMIKIEHLKLGNKWLGQLGITFSFIGQNQLLREREKKYRAKAIAERESIVINRSVFFVGTQTLTSIPVSEEIVLILRAPKLRRYIHQYIRNFCI